MHRRGSVVEKQMLAASTERVVLVRTTSGLTESSNTRFDKRVKVRSARQRRSSCRLRSRFKCSRLEEQVFEDIVERARKALAHVRRFLLSIYDRNERGRVRDSSRASCNIRADVWMLDRVR